MALHAALSKTHLFINIDATKMDSRNGFFSLAIMVTLRDESFEDD